MEKTSGEFVLEGFKASDRSEPETAVALLTDQDLQRVVVAWPKVAPRWIPPRKKPPENQAARWDWLWQAFNEASWEGIYDDLADATMLPGGMAVRVFEVARRLRLVFPDGTISQWARGVLRSQVAAVARPRRREIEESERTP